MNEKDEINKNHNLQNILNELSLNIESQISNTRITLKTFENIVKFFNDEIIFWNKHENRKTNLNKQIDHLHNCIENLENFKKTFNKINEIMPYWENIKSLLSANKIQERYMIFSKTPEGLFLSTLYKENNDQGEASLNYFSRINVSNMNNPNYFDGFLKTYEFVHQSDSNILKRRKQENKCLSDLRNNWEQKTNDLNQQFEEQKRVFTQWTDDFIQNHTL